MSNLRAENGQVVTEEMIDAWSTALDVDEWPDGWHNVGDVVHGLPPVSGGATATISLKVSAAMKKAIEREAKNEGMSTSAFARQALEEKLLATG